MLREALRLLGIEMNGGNEKASPASFAEAAAGGQEKASCGGACSCGKDMPAAQENPSMKEEILLKKEPPRTFSTYGCPFCRQKALVFVRQTMAVGGRFDGEHFLLECQHCGARGPLAATQEECVEKWNAPGLEWNRLALRAEELEKRAEKAEAHGGGKADPLSGMKLDGWGWKTVVLRTPARRRCAVRPPRTGWGRKRRIS